MRNFQLNRTDGNFPKLLVGYHLRLFSLKITLCCSSEDESVEAEDNKVPERLKSAFDIFVQLCWDEHQESYPEADVQYSDMLDRCTEQWKVIKL